MAESSTLLREVSLNVGQKARQIVGDVMNVRRMGANCLACGS